MRLELERCIVRSWQRSDADALVRHADNRNIWINLRDAFSHPYTRRDARRWLSFVTKQKPETNFAIEVDGEAVGAVGYKLGEDVERVSAEIGYWVAEPYWGRGIATEALRAVTAYAMETHDLARLFAIPFEWNTASFRVLEKAGYQLEGRMRCAIVKDGRILDALLYSYTLADLKGEHHDGT